MKGTDKNWGLIYSRMGTDMRDWSERHVITALVNESHGNWSSAKRFCFNRIRETKDVIGRRWATGACTATHSYWNESPLSWIRSFGIFDRLEHELSLPVRKKWEEIGRRKIHLAHNTSARCTLAIFKANQRQRKQPKMLGRQKCHSQMLSSYEVSPERERNKTMRK